jgi:quercetin dioxygenase-like cupin family protein
VELPSTRPMLCLALGAVALLVSSCTSSSSAEAGQPADSEEEHRSQSVPEQISRPLVPGACSEPASENAGRPGCFMTAEITIQSPPAEIYWHVYSFPTAAAAAAAVRPHRWSVTTESHGLHWGHVLAPKQVRLSEGRRVAAVGPMALEAGKVIRARFIESYFVPGMRTSVHSHPGPEAFYVLDGVQCMEMPGFKASFRAGETLVVPARRIHFQASPSGRRNMGVVFYPPNEPWMKMETGWSPTTYCNPEHPVRQ